MKTINKIIIVLSILFFASCEDVIDVKLNTAAPKLVVEASLNWDKGTIGAIQKIKLTTTYDYYSTIIPVVSGASVIVTNSTGIIFNFIETPNTGEYICSNFVTTINETYTLTINNNGEIYTASEKLLVVPVIENNVQQNNDGGFAGDEIDIKFFFQDNGAENNFYMNSFQSSATPFPIYDNDTDEFYQGNQMLADFSNKNIHVGDAVTMKLFGISQRYYDYMSKIVNTTGGGGDPFSTTPAAIKGNIINQTNSSNYALGYFRLSEVDTKIYTVQ